MCFGAEYKLVWSTRGVPPKFCISISNREMTAAYVNTCPIKGTRLARPRSNNEMLGCADKDTGVMRWPVTGRCWWENSPVKWFAEPTAVVPPTATTSTTTIAPPTATTSTTVAPPTATTSTTVAPSTTTTLPDTTPPTVTLARSAATSSSAPISFTVTGNEDINCATLSLTAGTDFTLTNISTITSITQTSSDVCTIIAVSTATANGDAVVSTLTRASTFSIDDTAGNSQTVLAGSPQSVTVTRNGEPNAPVISSTTAGNTRVTVVWSTPASNGSTITDYLISYATSAGDTYTTFADGVSTATSATVTGLTNGTAYYFKVAATNSVGTGSNSVASAAATPTLPTQTVTWSPTTALTTAQSPNTPLAASSSGDGAITYAVQSAGATGCTINSSERVLTFTSAGSCVIRATAATTSNYLTGYIDATFTVTAATCANGGACIVGNTGPGGGIVFYVQAADGTFNCGVAFTSTCRYLEAAPNTWSGGSADPTKLWAVSAYQSTDVTAITNNFSAYNTASGIGLGYKNSLAIVAQGNGTTTAAGAARAYAGGSQSDWYLPTTAELNLLCQWARNVAQSVTTPCAGGTLNTGTGASGGFSPANYWSSSESAGNDAWYQSFTSGGQDASSKNYSTYVRPVRAFG